MRKTLMGNRLLCVKGGKGEMHDMKSKHEIKTHCAYMRGAEISSVRFNVVACMKLWKLIAFVLHILKVQVNIIYHTSNSCGLCDGS